MERVVAYPVNCNECFAEKLREGNFEVERSRYGSASMVRSKITDTCLGDLYSFHFVVRPGTSTMLGDDIAERTRLIRMCDELKLD